MKIVHLHGECGFYNGRLIFLVNNRLLGVFVGTPNFNDYGEWRISGFKYSTKDYNPEDNEIELKPYDSFPDIEISDFDLEFLNGVAELEIGDGNGLYESFFNKFGEYNEELAGGQFKGESHFTIFDDSEEYNRKNVNYDEWLKKKDKKPFEKIFYTILYEFQKSYRNSKKH